MLLEAIQKERVCRKSMAECNIDLPTDKLCKYSYMSWCPTCDRDSPRRRTRSESVDACRRKGRDMKAFAPKKYDRRCEYENRDIDLDCDFLGLRYDRVRSNLCELPTTYISNNCQLNVSHTKLSSTNDFVDVKIPRDYANSYVLKRDCSPPQDRLSKWHSITAQPLKRHNIHRADSPSTSYSNEREPCPDTCTFFDMNFDAKMVRERYTRELDILRNKLRDLHSQKYSHMGPPVCIKHLDQVSRRRTTNVDLEDIHVIDNVQDPKVDSSVKYSSEPALNDSRKMTRIRDQKSATKIAVKTSKARYSSARPPKLKLRMLKKNTVLMEDDSTTESEMEELLCKNRVPKPDGKVESPKNKLPLASDTVISRVVLTSISPKGDSEMPIWPVRHSLFPHIPPYLDFSMHDSAANKLPAGKRFMKWKLSTITPVIVRKTLINTGFRLVRIVEEFEHEGKVLPPRFCLERSSKIDLMRNYYNVQCPYCTSVTESNDWTGTWGKHMKSPMFKTLKNCQKLNHFAGTFQLGRKDRLWKNVQRLIHRYGHREFGFIPQTFILPQDLRALKQCWECKDGSAGEKWIIKPPASARGVGIKVINKWSQLPKQTSIVVQKYIANPYLINGSKFDLRLYVLVTSFNPLRIYLYPEGLVRFASVKYSDNDKDLKDRFMHLTNYSINKLSSQYTANEDANSCQGHKWTLTKLWEYLSDRRVNTDALWETLKELVIKTMLSGESPITQLCTENVGSRYNCYELFGVDVLFDERLKPWLLEVNISPSLHSASPLDMHVKGPLVQTLFNLAQFHLPPKVSRCCETSPAGFDPRIYTMALTPQESSKHSYFMQMAKRDDYLLDILEQLTGDDVRLLTQAEDELVVQGDFERIFPTSKTYQYLEFIPVRYYNRLFDAWETRYEDNRERGIELLQDLCMKRIHLKVQPPPVREKNFRNTTLGAAVTSTSMDERLSRALEKPNAQKTELTTSAHIIAK